MSMLDKWSKIRTKNSDGAASQVGPFPHSMATLVSKVCVFLCVCFLIHVLFVSDD